MHEQFSPELEASYNSYNGGIPMLLGKLANVLVDPGIDSLIKDLDHELENTEENARQADLRRVIKAIESLDPQKLVAAIAPLTDLFPKLKASNDLLEQHAEELKCARTDWQLAAEPAKQQLRAWQRWALEKEQERHALFWRRPTLPAFCYPSNHRLMGGTTVFESPERLEHQYAYFEFLVNAIDEAIAQNQAENKLPHDLQVRQFHSAIKALETIHRQFKTILQREASELEEWKTLWRQYQTDMAPLNRLLWQMPESACRSLFRLYRSEAA